MDRCVLLTYDVIPNNNWLRAVLAGGGFHNTKYWSEQLKLIYIGQLHAKRSLCIIVKRLLQPLEETINYVSQYNIETFFFISHAAMVSAAILLHNNSI